MKLSIIVPVYNVENYLRRCVDSILAQSFSDFELILIDDGSPDRCGAIIDRYAEEDARIIAVHQSNKGVSEARNAGLRIARGEYIGFVDPDDWIEPDMYSVLVGHIENDCCDIASCSWMVNDEEGREFPYDCSLHSKVMTGKEYMGHLFDMPPSISGSVWSKLFKKEIIKNDFSAVYQICEDNVFPAHCCVLCRKAVYIDRPLYHIYMRENSATRENPHRVVYGLPARREIIEIAGRKDRECKMLAERVFLDQCVAYSGDSIEEQYRNYAIRLFTEYIRENYMSVIRNRMIPFKERVLYCFLYLKWKYLFILRRGNTGTI